MLEPHLLDDLGRLKAAALSEDGGVAYQSIGAVGAMTMSYMVTVVHLCSLGELRLDVIDSRSGKDSLSSIKEELEHDGREVQCRLVIAEDLPRDTYDLLQHTIGVDARLLDDHRRDGHGSGFVGQADLDIDKAPRASSTSVAMPFDLQIGPEIFPTATGWRGDEYVEEEVNGILKHHQLVNYLRYDWQPFFIGRPLPALFYTTYRRLSYQNISGAIPTIAILLSPPLWDPTSFQGTKYQFHVSADLRFPPNPRRDTKLPPRPVARGSELALNRAGCSVRIRQLIDHLTNGVDFDDLSSNTLSRSVQAWITINTYRSFEASVESSIRCWYNVKSYLKATSSGHVGKKRLCERFRHATLIKRHRMDKARNELELHNNTKSEPRTTNNSDVSHEDYTLQQWQRSQSSLQWVLDDVEDALHSNEGDLHMELTTLQIEESRKAIRQGAVIKRLTALAFVFIPISTVCSAFGMNLREFGKVLPPAWVFAVVALTVVSFFFASSFVHSRSDSSWTKLDVGEQLSNGNNVRTVVFDYSIRITQRLPKPKEGSCTLELKPGQYHLVSVDRGDRESDEITVIVTIFELPSLLFDGDEDEARRLPLAVFCSEDMNVKLLFAPHMLVSKGGTKAKNVDGKVLHLKGFLQGIDHLDANATRTSIIVEVYPGVPGAASPQDSDAVELGNDQKLGMSYLITAKLFPSDEKTLKKHPVPGGATDGWELVVSKETEHSEAAIVGSISNSFFETGIANFVDKEETGVSLDPIFMDIQESRGRSAMGDFRSVLSNISKEMHGFFVADMNRPNTLLPAATLFLERPCNEEENLLDTIDKKFTEELNASQHQVLKTALSSKISVAHGPPGTGKSTVLGAIVLYLIAVLNELVAATAMSNAFLSACVKAWTKMYPRGGIAPFARLYSEGQIRAQWQARDTGRLNSPYHIDQLRYKRALEDQFKWGNYLQGRQEYEHYISPQPSHKDEEAEKPDGGYVKRFTTRRCKASHTESTETNAMLNWDPFGGL
ncbi:MAG: hypothetical protein Q9171_002419 [Xanthocarpia ochracea]